MLQSRFRQSIITIVILSVICSCNTNSGPVKVIIDKKAMHLTKIAIDRDQVFTITSDTTLTLTLPQGEHTVAVNDSASREFTVGKNGGILNLDDQEYVAYEIKYVAENTNNSFGFDISDMVVKSTILIDSFIIVPKGPLSKADSVLRKMIPQLQASKDGNYYYGSIDGENEGFHGLKKTGKGKLFIDKFWDYNMGDPIPKTIQIRTSKNPFGKVSETRSAILPAKLFLMYAILSGEEFTVKTIKSVVEGKEDEEKEKALEEKQMSF